MSSTPSAPSADSPKTLRQDRLRPGFYAFVAFTLRILYRLLFRVRVRGRENVPMSGPLLVASNHASHLDPPALGSFLPRPLRFMAKEELFRVPVLGPVIGWLGAIPVARGGADRAAVQAIADVLRRANAVLIFPEGTRSGDGRLQEPKTGIGWMATQIEDAQILPVFIEGSFDAWPRQAKWPRPRRMVIHIGPPSRPSELIARRRERDAAANKPPGETGEAPDAQKTAASASGKKVDENRAAGAKKRLYWELAEEIMSEIAKVQRGTSR